MAFPQKFSCALTIFLGCISAAATARAFSSPGAYSESPAAGGGGGRWFSGSPADGLGCSVCHSAAPSQRTFPLYTAGLPTAGYELMTQHEVVLSWPEFAQRWTELRPDPMAAPIPGQPAPAVGLVAELIAESGAASGVIEVSTASASPAELCEQTRPNLQPRLGAQLYQVRPGVAPVLLKPDAMGRLRCESRQLGQRCIIALSSCGAKQIRFTWTTPSTWQGPIWFSAGFVASEALSGTFDQDSVEEVSFPMVQAGTPSATYEERLQSACTLIRPRSHSRLAALGLGAFAIALLAARARRRARERS